jgi:hypothetical protein
MNPSPVEKLGKLILDENVENHVFNVETHSTQSVSLPDFDKVAQFIRDNIKSPQDIEGSYKGMSGKTLLKLAIQSGFTELLTSYPNSAENYRMIRHLRNAIPHEHPFWEEREENATDHGHPHLSCMLNASPASMVVARRMSLECFSMGKDCALRLAEAHSTAKLFQDSPSFLTELKQMGHFCQLDTLVEERPRALPRNMQIIEDTAKAITHENYEALINWTGDIAHEVENSVKLTLFTGDPHSKILEKALLEMQEPTRRVPTEPHTLPEPV